VITRPRGVSIGSYRIRASYPRGRAFLAAGSGVIWSARPRALVAYSVRGLIVSFFSSTVPVARVGLGGA
jgi:hypothetical protein